MAKRRGQQGQKQPSGTKVSINGKEAFLSAEASSVEYYGEGEDTRGRVNLSIWLTFPNRSSFDEDVDVLVFVRGIERHRITIRNGSGFVVLDDLKPGMSHDVSVKTADANYKVSLTVSVLGPKDAIPEDVEAIVLGRPGQSRLFIRVLFKDGVYGQAEVTINDENGIVASRTPTDDKGELVYPAKDDESLPGKSFIVTVRGLAKSITVLPKSDAKPEQIPTTFDAHSTGKEGDSEKIIVQVYTGREGDRRACKAIVELLNEQTGVRIEEPTEDSGVLVWSVPAHSGRVAYVVSVRHLEKKERMEFDSPPPYRRPPAVPEDYTFWQGIWFRLRTNNNARLAFIWILVLALGIFNLSLFGLGDSSTMEEHKTYQDYQKLDDADKAFTEGISSLKGLSPVPVNPSSINVGYWSFGAWLKRIWVWLLIIGIVYIPIAIRDEFRRALWRTRRIMSRINPEGIEITQGPVGSQPRTRINLGGLSGKAGWTLSFLFTLLQQLAVEYVGQRFLGHEPRP